jgi:hypothetical protein
MPTIVTTQREPPEDWSVHRSRAISKWILPFVVLEWMWEWLAYWLSGWAFLEALEYGERLSILVAIIFYFADAGNRAKQKHYQAWQVINTAQGKGGSGGRVEALEDKVSLIAVDVSGAYLFGIKMDRARMDRSNFHAINARDGSFRKAKLEYADFSSANLRRSNLMEADFRNANLADADLNGANLTGTDLAEADLSRTDLRNTDLTGVKWKDVHAIGLANIYAVQSHGRQNLLRQTHDRHPRPRDPHLRHHALDLTLEEPSRNWLPECSPHNSAIS